MSSPQYSGVCRDCELTTIIDSDQAPGPVPDINDWDSFSSCLVCGGTVDFDEQPETLWDRENRLMSAASQMLAAKIRAALDMTHRHGEYNTRQAVLAALPPEPVEESSSE